jgi:hypothetical protein
MESSAMTAILIIMTHAQINAETIFAETDMFIQALSSAMMQEVGLKNHAGLEYAQGLYLTVALTA